MELEYSEEYKMMLETILSTIKTQNENLVDGALIVVIPNESAVTEASILTWFPDGSEKDVSTIWQEMFVSILWTLMKAGVSTDAIHDIVKYADESQHDIDSSDISDIMFSEQEVN